jgi:hypothetical protein
MILYQAYNYHSYIEFLFKLIEIHRYLINIVINLCHIINQINKFYSSKCNVPNLIQINTIV